jgi:hypothetical protein
VPSSPNVISATWKLSRNLRRRVVSDERLGDLAAHADILSKLKEHSRIENGANILCAFGDFSG